MSADGLEWKRYILQPLHPAAADKTGRKAGKNERKYMIDQEKVMRMTRMAAYEQKKGKRDMAVAGYFCGDYVGMHMLVSWICITVAFCIGCGIFILLNMEEFMQDIYSLDLAATAKDVLLLYIAVTGIYLTVTYLIYKKRYQASEKRMEKYLDDLEALDEQPEE